MKRQDKIITATSAENNTHLMGIVKNDSYLTPFNEAICGRHNHAVERIKELTLGASKLFPTLPMDIIIMAYIK